MRHLIKQRLLVRIDDDVGYNFRKLGSGIGELNLFAEW